MTFKKQINSSEQWELTRFASDINYNCCGVGGKMFSYFIKTYNPQSVKSFADRRWTINEVDNLYTKIGFVFDSYAQSSYTYFNGKNGFFRQHKFNFRKSILNKKYGLPMNMTESEMTKAIGYHKVWDCGLIKYVWRK